MTRPRHPKPEIEKTIQYAEGLGWNFELSNGHTWGRLFCPKSTRDGCIVSVWSTPRSEDAILSAIQVVRKAGIAAEVLRVDECNLVTASEIARRMGRSRQLVHQYMNGQRGPGGFPPPECHLTDHAPLWAWCAVSYWLVQNNLLRQQESWNAEVVEAINNWLEVERQRQRYPELMDTITRGLQASQSSTNPAELTITQGVGGTNDDNPTTRNSL